MINIGWFGGFNRHNSLGFENFVIAKAHHMWQISSKEKIHPSCRDWSAWMITDCPWPLAKATARSCKIISELTVAKFSEDKLFQARRLVLETCTLLGGNLSVFWYVWEIGSKTMAPVTWCSLFVIVFHLVLGPDKRLASLISSYMSAW
jgi:hypothetical protein